MKVVINRCFGGFGLSKEAQERYKIDECDYRFEDEKPRHDPELVRAVEEMGDKANGAYSALMIIEWPDKIPYQIDEYDGSESLSVDWPAYIKKLADRFGSMIPTEELLKAIRR